MSQRKFWHFTTYFWAILGDILKHASDAGDAGDAGYLLKTYNQPCNSLLMSALYETMNSDAGKY